MKKILLLPILFFYTISYTQDLYNPQLLYNSPGSLFDTDSLRTMSINFYDSNYDSILKANWPLGTGLNLPATVQLSNGDFLDSVGVRYKGNSTYSIPLSLNNPKFPLNLEMNSFISGQKLMNYKTVKLANAFLDPTFCKEITGLNIYRKYLPSPEANMMKVNVQGDYLGLYVNTESVDKQFLKKHFNEKDGAFFKCDPIQQFGLPGPSGNADLSWRGTDTALYYNDYDLKSTFGWTKIRDLIYTLNFTPNLLDSILNIDRVLWAFAANTVVANLDTYNGMYQHNYYLYQTGDGLFQMIPWDLSESFEGALLGAATPDSMYHYDPYNGFNCLNTPLVSHLISNPDSHYGKIYTAHIRTILEESLDSTEIRNFVTYLHSICTPAAIADTNKLFSMFEYNYNVNYEYIIPSIISLGGITSTAGIRERFLLSNPEINQVPPSISSVQLLEQGGLYYVTSQVFNEEPDSVELLSTTSSYNSKFTSSKMYDDGTNGDLVSGDHMYTQLLPFQLSGLDVKFYVRAQNSNAVKLNPERAEYEFYIYSKSMNILNQEKNKTFLVYPNSTSSFINIESKTEIITNYSLYNIYGEEVLSQNVSQYKLKIDLSDLTRGIYLLHVNNKSFKIVKD